MVTKLMDVGWRRGIQLNKPSTLTFEKPQTPPKTVVLIDDNQLMQNYINGDSLAFEELYRRFKKPLYRYIKNSCESEASANELFQDVWLKLIHSRDKFQSQMPFKGWLFKIARNHLTDYYRQQGRRKEIRFEESQMSGCQFNETHDPLTSKPFNDLLTERQQEPDTFASAMEQSDHLEKGLKQLSGVQRDALLLHYIAGMTLKEIAEITNNKLETIKSRIRYATTKMREHLEISQ